jgi:hypothetical protein
VIVVSVGFVCFVPCVALFFVGFVSFVARNLRALRGYLTVIGIARLATSFSSRLTPATVRSTYEPAGTPLSGSVSVKP